jgi:hypothetical protein
MHGIFKLVVTMVLVGTGLCLAETGPLGFGKSSFDRELASDRPDFTETAQIVEAGHVQIEAGFTYTRDEEAGVKTETHTFPEFLARLGLTSDTELRLVWLGYLNEEVAGARDTGVSDFSVGLKHSMAQEGDSLPALSYLLELSAPVGSDEFSASDPELTFKFLWEKGLTEQLGLAGNVNFAALKELDSYILEPSASLSAGFSLTESIGSYLEYYGLYPTGSDVGPAHTVNGGFTYLMSKNLQFDVRAGFGVNDRADDFLAGTGLVIRF